MTEQRKARSRRASSRPGHQRVGRPDPLALPTARGTPLRLPPRVHDLSVDPDVDRRWLRSVPRPHAVDLFCGAGGLSLGLQQAGFHVVAAVDNDPVALETHASNIGGLTCRQDLSEPKPLLEFLAARGVRRVDLVAGGPPCQPFSRAGAAKIRDLVQTGIRSERDDRVALWRTFLAVVDALDPAAVLLENVPDMARWNDGEIVIAMLEALRARGYGVDARVLKAWEYGVPQHRMRLFLVGTRRPFVWPRRRPRVTLRDAIDDLPVIPPAQREEAMPYGAPRSSFQRRARRGMPVSAARVVFDHRSRDVRKDDAEAFGLLGEGATYRELPARLQRYRVDIFDDKYKRLAWDDLARSITAHIAKDGYWYIHPEQDRTLSIREAARVQTFPDGFRFAGHPTVQFRQIGNAVPPALARAVGQRLMASLSASGGQARGRSPREALISWHERHGRHFPWRGERDPWRVLLTEMCLHRTRAGNVEPLYQQVMEAAPTPAATVQNAPAVLAQLWPLGLRWRSAKVIETAREIVARFGGEVPRNEADLRSLPGIGDYAASAVRCFAYGEPAVLIDANTRRIVSRFTGLEASSSWTIRLEIFRLAGTSGPDEQFNYALLDLGALVCRARGPLCAGCPLRRDCRTAATVGVS
jgi:DNA (cytosine-5)-methyltransferase 1